jgi:hypothetical protein
MLMPNLCVIGINLDISESLAVVYCSVEYRLGNHSSLLSEFLGVCFPELYMTPLFYSDM